MTSSDRFPVPVRSAVYVLTHTVTRSLHLAAQCRRDCVKAACAELTVNSIRYYT